MVERSERSRARSARMGKFGFSVHMRSDVPGMRPLYEMLISRKIDAEERKKMKEWAKKAAALAAVQRSGGSDLYVDKYLRHFISEYNGRVLQGEGMHMPSSFNIMRAFIEPAEDAMILQILPQQESIVSFNKMLDHITDPGVDTSISNALLQMDDLTVYEINMLGGHAEFKIPGNEQHVFCGVAFCRDGDEISLLGVFGRENPEPRTAHEKLDPAHLNPDKPFLRSHAESADLRDHPLFGDEGYAPIILLARVDAKAGTIHSRMVMDETRDTFHVASDDRDDLEYIIEKLGPSAPVIDSIKKRIDDCSSLFEILFAVPSCLSLMEGDDVRIERHPTKLRLEPNGVDAKSASRLTVREAPRYVNVSALYDLGRRSRPSYYINPSNLKIETSGYWRNIGLAKEGADKSGNTVQGKTWVTTQKSWIEDTLGNSLAHEGSAKIEPLQDPDDFGWIYVMRNAAHGRDVYKIGFTTRPVEERAAQLGNTSGQPDMFNIVQSWLVRAPRTIEYIVHDVLKESRINNRREFFQIKYEKIRSVIEKVIEQSGARLEE